MKSNMLSGMTRNELAGITKTWLIIIALLFAFTTSGLAQQTSYNHPELKWMTIESKHAVVHFHEGAERTAREIAAIADLVYAPITGLYGYEPDGKINWIVRDHDDYSNGASYYYDQKIEIWASPLDFELRGQHNWLYNVVTHEFTHMIQLGKARKAPRWLPQVYFQGFGYETEKRPDVLYGYPNAIVSWPVIGTVVPMWFAEGTAQFQAPGLGFEYWDSHRDMIMRTRVLDGRMLTMNEMGVFASKTSYGNESVYNHGFALVRYIADTWGVDALKELTKSMHSPFNWSFDRSCRQVLGLSEQELHRIWRDDLYKKYRDRTAIISDNIVSGRVISDEGFGNFYPAFSPDGKRIAFISNKDKDYLSLGSLYMYDIEKDSVYATKCPANGPIDWSPDGRYIAYSAKGNPDKHGSHFNDIYFWDLQTDKPIRISKHARLIHPSFSADGRHIVAVHNGGGSQNLVLLDLPETIEGRDISSEVLLKRLTEFNDGTQIFQPRFSPDGGQIVCSTANLAARDIYIYDLETDVWKPLLKTRADDRDPFFAEDGRTIYWSCDSTGISNLYRTDLETGSTKPLTNVIGGAFMPVVSDDGTIAYAEFTVKGYGLRLLEEAAEVDPVLMRYLADGGGLPRDLESPPRIDAAAKPYSNPFGSLFLIPRLFWDHGSFKPGIYAMTSDMLEKISLFGSIAATPRGEADLYLDLQYRVLYPTLFVQAFRIIRKQSQTFDDPFVIVGEDSVGGDVVPVFGKYSVDYKFNLTEVDLGGKVPIGNDLTLSAFGRISEYKSAIDFDDGSSFDYTYHRGRALILHLDFDKLGISAAMDIHPVGGWRGWLEYARENNRFIEGFKVDAEKGTIGEVYKSYNYHRVEGDFNFYQKIWGGLVFNPRLMAGAISDSVDSFYHLYAGGMIGMRGYSFYSLGGTRKAVLRTSLRFPVLSNIDARWGPFYLDRINGALFAETGDAWTGRLDPARLKKDIGAELRFSLFSWYVFPTDLQIAAAHGLDRFDVTENGNRTEYGREWRWYLTLLFSFL